AADIAVAVGVGGARHRRRRQHPRLALDVLAPVGMDLEHGNEMGGLGALDGDLVAESDLHGGSPLAGWDQRITSAEPGGFRCPRLVSAQCLKCRVPVKIMASPRSSAAAMTSSSRSEPPGW